jgi:hypothetical protein
VSADPGILPDPSNEQTVQIYNILSIKYERSIVKFNRQAHSTYRTVRDVEGKSCRGESGSRGNGDKGIEPLTRLGIWTRASSNSLKLHGRSCEMKRLECQA